jgi:hypothetical protein
MHVHKDLTLLGTFDALSHYKEYELVKPIKQKGTVRTFFKIFENAVALISINCWKDVSSLVLLNIF